MALLGAPEPHTLQRPIYGQPSLPFSALPPEASTCREVSTLKPWSSRPGGGLLLLPCVDREVQVVACRRLQSWVVAVERVVRP
jgi:hypothetical protein